MKLYSKIVLVSLLGLGLTACGGGSNADGSDSNAPLIGSFVDAPVEGIAYKTATQAGTTDIEGHYRYQVGEEVTFSIGNVVLGTTKAKKTITPLTLAGDSSLSAMSPKATNIARLLQSLDEKSNDASHIKIPDMLSTLKVENGDISNETILATILEKASIKAHTQYQLIDKESAKEHMKRYYQNFIYSGTYDVTSQYTGGSLPASMCANRLIWDVSISKDGNVQGTSNTDSQRLALGFSMKEDKIQGISSGTKWDATIDEDGTLRGTYDYLNGGCKGTIIGKKK